jgi:hypothetical protein
MELTGGIVEIRAVGLAGGDKDVEDTGGLDGVRF